MYLNNSFSFFLFSNIAFYLIITIFLNCPIWTITWNNNPTPIHFLINYASSFFKIIPPLSLIDNPSHVPNYVIIKYSKHGKILILSKPNNTKTTYQQQFMWLTSLRKLPVVTLLPPETTHRLKMLNITVHACRNELIFAFRKTSEPVYKAAHYSYGR